jgi:hypothetical protein
MKFLCALLLAIPLVSFGQADNPQAYIKKYFLLIQSTKNYDSALVTARAAARQLAIKLDLRDLIPVKDKFVGLSMPKDSCRKYAEEEGGDDYPCYMARGRWDEGVYISIEYSTAYKEFREGYYIVVVASSVEKDQQLMATLQKVKTKYPDAYVRMSKVYMGCMH